MQRRLTLREARERGLPEDAIERLAERYKRGDGDDEQRH
jgi:hypothetical protein